MAMINCPECGKQVSSRASSCPNCGFPIQDVINKEALTASENIQNHMVQCKKCGVWNDVGSTYCKSCNRVITGEDYIYTNKKTSNYTIPITSKNGFPTQATENKNLPFFSKTWFIIFLMCSCCFPLGLFLMWKYKKFNEPVRVIITTIYTFMFICISIANNSLNTTESTSPNNLVESESIPTTDTTAVSDVTDVGETIVVEISESLLPEDEFKAACQEIEYKTLLRTPDEYIGEKIVIVAEVQQIMQGGWFDDGKYYRLQTDDDGSGYYLGDEYFMYDCRTDDSLKILNEDVIKIYAEFAGLEEVKRALTGVKDEVPAIKAYYIDLISE